MGENCEVCGALLGDGGAMRASARACLACEDIDEFDDEDAAQETPDAP